MAKLMHYDTDKQRKNKENALQSLSERFAAANMRKHDPEDQYPKRPVNVNIDAKVFADVERP